MIVLGFGVVVAAWVNRDLIRIKIASVYARVAPKPGASSPASSAAIAPMSGDAPWALSALPECFTQVSESSGSGRYVRAQSAAQRGPDRAAGALIVWGLHDLDRR